MKTGKIIGAAIFGAIMLSQLGLFAQAGPPGPGGGAPIDGGAIVLVIAIAAYAYWQIKKDNAKTKEQILICEAYIKNSGKGI